ncbi:MAG TPA: hypothetical protein GXZ90_02915, partial [Clostridiales bacterium]|nr:hypothetical protein [Clostridiales bacterium]
MLVIDKLVGEFESVYAEFISAKENNLFHEASDILSFMTGITRAMTITLDTHINDYTLSDREKVDKC